MGTDRQTDRQTERRTGKRQLLRSSEKFLYKRTKKQGKCMQYWAIDLNKCSLLNMEAASSSETVKQTRYITQCKDLVDHHFCNIRRENLNTYQYILVNDQLDALFFSVFISTPLHVSSSKCSSSGGQTCINTQSGITHSSGWLSGRSGGNSRPACQTVTH